MKIRKDVIERDTRNQVERERYLAGIMFNALDLRNRLIASLLSAPPAYICRLPGFYSDEYSTVYRVKADYYGGSHKIVVLKSFDVSVWDSIEDLLEFYRKHQSDSQHNLDSIRILEGVLESEGCKA